MAPEGHRPCPPGLHPLPSVGWRRYRVRSASNDDVTTWLSFRNLEKVNILPVAEANTYELLDNKQLVFTAEALKRIEEVLA